MRTEGKDSGGALSRTRFPRLAAVPEPSLNIVDPVTSRAWAQLVSSRPSTLFHSPAWMRVIQATYGISFSACLWEQGCQVGGVPWTQTTDLLGARRITLPFSDFCDVLAPSPQVARVLAQYVADQGRPWNLRTLARNIPDMEIPVAQSTLFKWQSVDLSPDLPELWTRLSSMARRGVRKAERNGVEVRHASGKQQLRDWYQLHLKLRKTKYGLLAQPYTFFENIWDTFVESEQGFLLVAMYEGRVIAAILFLFWQDTCYYKFTSSDPYHLSLRPNNLLLWRGIQEAKERGFRLLDLGRSNARQTGLVAFKRAFGASEEDLLDVTYRPDAGGSDEETDVSRLLRDVTQLFVKDSVPDNITEEAGALLYRFFT